MNHHIWANHHIWVFFFNFFFLRFLVKRVVWGELWTLSSSSKWIWVNFKFKFKFKMEEERGRARWRRVQRLLCWIWTPTGLPPPSAMLTWVSTYPSMAAVKDRKDKLGEELSLFFFKQKDSSESSVKTENKDFRDL